MVFHAYHAFPFLNVPQIFLQGGPELIRVLLWWWSTKLTTNPNQNMKIAQWGFWASFGPQFSRLPFKVFRVRFWSFAKTWRKTFLWSVRDPQGIYIHSIMWNIYIYNYIYMHILLLDIQFMSHRDWQSQLRSMMLWNSRRGTEIQPQDPWRCL